MLINVLTVISRWAIPFLLLVIPLYGFLRKVPVYEAFVEGAQEGFTTAVKIIPFLVGMLVAISVFRASGAMESLSQLLGPALRTIGTPAEVLPLAIMRPLSGSGVLGMATELMRTYGPDSFVGRVASTLMGSTETTFYTLSIYFGAIGIKKIRYTLWGSLLSDIVGLFAAIIICSIVFGS